MNTKQAVLGLGIVVFGIITLLSNMDVAPFREVFSHWWPLAIIAAGLYILWQDRQNLVWSLIVMGIGLMTLFNTLDVADIDVGQLIWPLIITGVGVTIVASAVSRNGARRQTSNNHEESMTAFMSGVTSKNVTDDYRGGSTTAIMGGVELDLSKAAIKSEATLRVFVLMGGIELRVSEDVVVKNRSTSLLGGIEEKTWPTKSKNAPVLYIEGTVALGGIEIKR